MNLKFLFISYLNDNKQTEYAIDYLLKQDRYSRSNHFNQHNVTYCLIDGQVIHDNQLIEDYFKDFLNKSYMTMPKECLELNILSFINIFDLTLFKFFDCIIKKNVFIVS